jgi:hypothetical protein
MTELFNSTGIQNTEEVLRIASEYAKKNSITHIVIASTTGWTAKEALKFFDPSQFNVVIVTHNTGFGKDGEQEFSEEIRKELISKGYKVLTGTMVLRNLNRAIKDRFHYSETEIVNATLRMFGEGTKVCFEICAMACDAGLIPPAEVIAIAGTSRGADTAAVIKAKPSNRFFDMKLIDYICKPSLR